MIETKGTYHFSKDGGKTWLEVSNMLVRGYYQYPDRRNVFVGVGDGSAPPNYENSNLPSKAFAQKDEGLPQSSVEITDDFFKINTSNTFDLGTGHQFIARDIGMSCGGQNLLFSRALFKDNNGDPISIKVNPKDILTIKFTLTYLVPRAPRALTINVAGKQVTGTIKACNPNKWGTIFPSKPVDIGAVGVGATGSWTLNKDGYVDTNSSGLENHSLNYTYNYTGYEKKHTWYRDYGLSTFNKTFKQIAFSAGSFSANNLVILIDLDEEVTITDKDNLAMGIDILQVGSP